MAVPTIQQIVTPLTPDQARAAVQNIIIALGIPANQWAAGGRASSLLTGAGNILSMLSGQLANGVAALFLPTAVLQSNGVIQLLAQYFYGVIVPQATFASGLVTLTNTSGAIYNVAAGQFTVTNIRTGASYTNPNAFTLNAGSSANVTFAATVAGSSGNANPGDITGIGTPLLGVTCTNVASFVGRDALTNQQVYQLCIDSLGARSVRGPRGAYGFAISGTDFVTGAPLATNAVTGAPVNINRWTISFASHTGQATVVICGPDGTTDPGDLTGVVASVEQNARPGGVTATVSPATPVPYAATLTPWVVAPSSVAAATIQSAIATGITAFMSSPDNPIGGQTADDDSSPGGLTGLLGGSVFAAAAAAVASIGGCRLISLQGATDIALSSMQVATDSVTVLAPRVQVSGA